MMPIAWLQEVSPQPIPAQPPISGPIWGVVIPALLLVFTAVATYMLYRRFERQEGQGGR